MNETPMELEVKQLDAKQQAHVVTEIKPAKITAKRKRAKAT